MLLLWYGVQRQQFVRGTVSLSIQYMLITLVDMQRLLTLYSSCFKDVRARDW